MTDMEMAVYGGNFGPMSAEHFREFADYVERTDMLPEDRRFMERVVFIAEMKRKERVYA